MNHMKKTFDFEAPVLTGDEVAVPPDDIPPEYREDTSLRSQPLRYAALADVKSE